MTLINYQTSDNRTVVNQELADPSFPISTPYSFTYQHHGQPATFNPNNVTFQPSVASGHSPLVPLSSVSYGTPYSYPAPPFVRSVPAGPVSVHHTAHQLPSLTHGQTVSTQTSAGPQSSPHQYPNDSYPQSISRDPETIVTPTTEIDAVAVTHRTSPIKNTKPDSGRSQPGKAARPGRAGTLKCARCRRQKRGSKVSTP